MKKTPIAALLAHPFSLLRGSTAVMTAMMALSLCLISLPAQAVTLCYDGGEQYPWILKDGKGLNIVLLDMVAAKTGEKLELTGMPWKQCLEGVKKGTIDGAFAASYSDERAKFAAYPMADGKLDRTRRLHTDGYTLLRLKGSKVGWDGRKFSNLTGAIGTQSSYSIIADLTRWGAKVDSNSDTPETLLKRFGSGQLQAIALLTGEARFALKKPYLANKVEIVSPPLTEKPYFLIFGRGYYDKNQKKADDIWSMIEQVRESAEYKAREPRDQSSR
jgi:polar amino acid transport system substrate-binding protein